jgi:tetratricopeptide (TPR) repeat protein
MKIIWETIVNHWFEILLALAVVVSVLRILVSMWVNPQGMSRALKTLFSGTWADIRVTVLIIVIAVAIGLGFVYKRLDLPFTGLLWAVACLAVGWLVGFLFGIPKVLQSDAALAQAQGNAAASGQQGATPGRATAGAGATMSQAQRIQFQVNTNLEQISDWLTKIIVGLGLINLKQVPDYINRLANFMGPALGEDGGVMATAIFLYFSSLGFMGGYVTTRLWLAGAFSRADQAVGLPLNDEQRSVVLNEDLNFEKPKFSAAAAQASSQVVNRPLDELTSKEDVLIWAKAQLSQGNYDSAVNGYAKAAALAPDDIELRLEYAVALYYAKRPVTQVRDQIQKAYDLMKGTPGVSQDIKRKVYRELTYHLLFQPPPAGFSEAIRYGEEYVNDPANQPIVSGAVPTNLAAAYGQKARWLVKHREVVSDFDSEFKRARDAALNAVRQAIQIDKKWKDKLTELLQKNYPGKDKGENDLEIFENDNEFRAALDLPPVSPPANNPAPPVNAAPAGNAAPPAPPAAADGPANEPEK